MDSERPEIIARQAQQKSLPEKLRNLGLVCLVSPFIPGWEGPEPQGYTLAGACSVQTTPEEGTTCWYFFPKGKEVPFDESILQEKPFYVLERMERRTHTPVRSWVSVLIPIDKSGNN